MIENLHLRPGSDELVQDGEGGAFIVRWLRFRHTGILLQAQVMGAPFYEIGAMTYGIFLETIYPKQPVSLPLSVRIGDSVITLHGPLDIQRSSQ